MTTCTTSNRFNCADYFQNDRKRSHSGICIFLHTYCTVLYVYVMLLLRETEC